MTTRNSATLLGVFMFGALAIAGCAQTTGTPGAKLAPGEKLKITRSVWDDYQAYLARGLELGHKRRHGAFGVALVGDVGVAGLYSYRYCPKDYDNCVDRGGPTYIEDILTECRHENVECLIFARDDSIQVPYEIID